MPRSAFPNIVVDVNTPLLSQRDIIIDEFSHGIDRTTRAVRIVGIVGTICALCAALAAVYTQSGAFMDVYTSSMTKSGLLTADVETLRSSRDLKCDDAFYAVDEHTMNETSISSSVSVLLSSEAIDVIYVQKRDAARACASTSGTRLKTVCVDREKLIKCASDHGLSVRRDGEFLERFVLISSLNHAKRVGGYRTLAYADGHEDIGQTAVAGEDSLELRSLLASEDWSLVKIKYNTADALVRGDVASASLGSGIQDPGASVLKTSSDALAYTSDAAQTCRRACACVRASESSNLCKVASVKECALTGDDFFILRSSTFDDLLQNVPETRIGSSATDSVASQYVLDLPASCLVDAV